jgi:hypothetical protein
MIETHFSVYIPRIFNNIPNKKIADVFEKLGLGEVSTMDIIYKTGSDGSKYKMAFIHFANWYNTSVALNFKNKIENRDIEAKLVYDDPWYWIVLPNTSGHKDNINTNIDISKKLQELENEVSCIYEELFQREYMPSIKPLWDTNTYENQSPMSISELDATPLHLPPRHAKIYPESDTFYDVKLDLDSESDDDDLSEITHYDNSQISYQDKLWMTQNVCDNA